VAWYDTDWSNAFEVTTDPAEIPSSQTDFPVHVDLSQLGGAHAFWTTVKSDGGDLRVTKSDGTTEVPMELVFIDTTAKTGVLYFSSDGTLDAVSADTFRVYYGNSGVSLPAASATYGSQNVWDANFAMVHHMDGAAYTDLDDSTSNGNDCTAKFWSPAFNQTGKSGKAVRLSNSPDSLTMGSDASIDFDGTDSFTVSCWARIDGGSGTDRVMVERYYSGSTYPYNLRIHSSNKAYLAIWDGTYAPIAWADNTVDSSWHYYSGVRHVADDKLYLYIDASLQGSGTTDTTTGSISNSGSSVGVGNQVGTSKSVRGPMDEVRISNVARSADWTTVEYNTINDATFLSYGAELSAPSAGDDPSAGGDPTPCQAILVLL